MIPGCPVMAKSNVHSSNSSAMSSIRDKVTEGQLCDMTTRKFTHLWNNERCLCSSYLPVSLRNLFRLNAFATE